MENSPYLVFIIGAGASKDFGQNMPVGPELADRIERILNEEFGRGGTPDGPISNALALSAGGFGANHVIAANRIRRAIHTKDSIDDLLDEWKDIPEMLQVGKVAIAHIIQQAECNSNLATNGD